MYHPSTGYSDAVLSSLGLSAGGHSNAAYQPVDQFQPIQAAFGASPFAPHESTFLLTPAAAPSSLSPSKSAQAQAQPSISLSSGVSSPYKAPRGGNTMHPHAPSAQALLAASPSHLPPPPGIQPSSSSLVSRVSTAPSDTEHLSSAQQLQALQNTAPPQELSACAFVLFILGPPGSGCTTICNRLVSELGFQHLDVNVLLNEEIKLGSNAGRLISDFLKLGKQVPGEMVADLLKHHISKGLSSDRAVLSSNSAASPADFTSENSSISATPTRTFFVVEHFPSDLVAWKSWQKLMNSGMKRVMQFELKGKAGGGLSYAIELKAPSSVCSERLLRRGDSGDEAATIERRLKHYDNTIQPLLNDISRFSLAILGKIQSTAVEDTVWMEVKNVVSALISRISLTPPLPSALTPFQHQFARQRIFPMVVLGGPGSGRSHLCRRLSMEFGFIHLNMEEIVLRASVEQEPETMGGNKGSMAGDRTNLTQTPQQIMASLMSLTTTGNETPRAILISALLKEGKAIPPELAIELLLEPLRHHLSQGNTLFVLDGFPSAAEQWKLFVSAIYGVDPENTKLMAQYSNHITGFYLECPERIRHSRLLRRRSYKDSPRTIESRMRSYESVTLPLEVSLMNSSPRSIFRIHASLSEGEVFREVSKRMVLSIVNRIHLADPPAQTQEEKAAEKAALLRELRLKAEKGNMLYRLGGTNALLTSAEEAPSDALEVSQRRPLARLLFLFGAPGSGKQTLATQLCQDYELVHLDLDQLVNKAIANRGTHRAAILQHLQSQNQQSASDRYGEAAILPSYIALDLISAALSTNMKAGSSFFLITGFPSSKAHYEAFMTHMAPQVQVLKCFYLDTNGTVQQSTAATGAASVANTASTTSLTSGASSTTTLKKSASTVSTTNNFVVAEDQRLCMERLTARGDHFDDVNLRLKIYHQNTKPLLEMLCTKPAQPTGLVASVITNPNPSMNNNNRSVTLSGANKGIASSTTAINSPTAAGKKAANANANGFNEPGVIGMFDDAPIYLLHASSKISKQALYDQIVLYLTDLNYLLLPASAKKQVSKSVVFVLFIMGGLGAGKKSITQKILHDYDFVHLEIDALLNEEIESGSNDGMILQQVFLHGGALPSETVASIVKRRIARTISSSKKTHFLISGFPIDELGWAAWVEVMGSAAEIPTAIYLDCPEEIRRERLLEKGEDETAIRQAFSFFNERTVPLIDSLTSKGTVITISSMEAIETVYSKVQSELEVLLHSLRAPINHSNLGTTSSRPAILSSTQSINAADGTLVKINPLASSQTIMARQKLPDLAKGVVEGEGENKVYLLGKRTQNENVEYSTDPSSNGPSGVGGTFPSNYSSLRYNLCFIFSSPGAGASTQIRRIRSQILDSSAGANQIVNLHFVCMEELVRAAIESGSSLGRTIGAHLKASIAAIKEEEARNAGIGNAQAELNSTALISRMFHQGANATDIISERIKPLSLISSGLLAQLLKQHLEQLLLQQEEVEYKSRADELASASNSLSNASIPMSKLNVLIEGFPSDERSWEEFQQVMSQTHTAASGSAATMDLRHQLFLDAPEGVRMDRMKKRGILSLQEIHARFNQYNTRLLPLIQKISLYSANELQPSFYHISTTPSADIVHLQIMNALHTKFGLYSPIPTIGRDGQVWKHPYGLRKRSEADKSTLAAADSTNAAVPKNPQQVNQSRPIFALFLFGPPGSGRTTLASSLTNPSSTNRDFELRSWGFIELDVFVLAEAEVAERGQGVLASKIKQHWAERNAAMLKDVTTLSRDEKSADARAFILPTDVSLQLLLSALTFHTRNLYNFSFLIRNFPQDAQSWSEWEKVTASGIGLHGDSGDSGARSKLGQEFKSLERKLRPLGLWLDAPTAVRGNRLKVGVGFSAKQVAQAEYVWEVSTKPLVENLELEGSIVRIDGEKTEHEVLLAAKRSIQQLMSTAVLPSNPVSVEEIQKMDADTATLNKTISTKLLTTGSNAAASAAASAPNKVVFVMGSPGSGRSTFCKQLCTQPFSLNPRNPHEPLVRLEHIDVEQLYRDYLKAHPTARIENEHISSASEQVPAQSRFAQARNNKLTLYLIRQAIMAKAPKPASVTSLLVNLPRSTGGATGDLDVDNGEEDEDDEEEAVDDLDVEDAAQAREGAAASLASSQSTTLFVVSGFPRDVGEWAGWQEELETDHLATLLLVVHLDVDLMTSTRRLLSRGDRPDLIKQDLNLYSYRTVPVLESMIHQASASGFGVLTIHAAAGMDDVMDEALTQLRRRANFAGAVEGEQLRLGALGDRRLQLTLKRKAQIAAAQQQQRSFGSTQGLVGSNSTIYNIGERHSLLVEIQSLLSQLPRVHSETDRTVSSPVLNLLFLVGPPGSGVSSHVDRSTRVHHNLASVSLDSLLENEVASGSRRGVLIANKRAERKPVSKWLRILLLLQQLHLLARQHVTSERSAAERGASTQAFIPTDSGSSVSVAARDVRIDPLPVLISGFPATEGEWNAWRRVIQLSRGDQQNQANPLLTSGNEEEKKYDESPALSSTPVGPLYNLSFVYFDVDLDSCIGRLLRSGSSTLSIDQRLAAYKKRTLPFIQLDLQSPPTRAVRIESESLLPAWNDPIEQRRKLLSTDGGIVPDDADIPMVFSLDARPREQVVYDTFVNLLRNYLKRFPIGAEAAAAAETRFADHAAGEVYTVGKPLDPRPPMNFFFLLGAPGAGVRTYLERIRARYDFEVVDMNALVASEVKKKGGSVTADSKAIAYHAQQKLLFPADLYLRLLFTNVLSQNSLGKSQFLIVGFPQTKAQWDLFESSEEMRTPGRLNIKKILFLDTPEKERIARMQVQLGSGGVNADGTPSTLPNATDIDVRIANYNSQTKKIMADLLAKNLLSRISTRSLNATASTSNEVLSYEDQVRMIFDKMSAEHIDPIWSFLRHTPLEQSNLQDSRVKQALVLMPGEKRNAQPFATEIPLPANATASGTEEEKSYDIVPGGAAKNPIANSLKPQPPLTARASNLPNGGRSASTNRDRLSSPHTLFVMFLMGGPGSGKRTNANRLEQHFAPNYYSIQMEKLESVEISRGTEAGKTILAARQHGRIPPASISMLLLNGALKQAALADKRLAIVTGFPEDIEGWRSWQNAYGTALPAMVYLVAPENVREARLLNENIPLYQIKTQQALFQNYTVPLLDLLAKHSPGSVTRISSMGSRDQVYEGVRAAVNKFLEGIEEEVHQTAEQRAAAAQAKAEAIARAEKEAQERANANASRFLKQFPTLDAKAARSQLEGEYLHVQMSAANLEKPDFFSTANPYFEFYRFVPRATANPGTQPKIAFAATRQEEEKQSVGANVSISTAGRWEKIYQSPVVFNTLNPKWNGFLLDNDYLTSRVLAAPVLLVVWSWAKGEQAKFIGSAQTSVKEMMECNATADGTGIKQLKLSKNADPGQNGLLAVAEGNVSSFLSNKLSSAGTVSISLCKRLVYRPMEEVISAAPRPPTAGRVGSPDGGLPSPTQLVNNGQVAVQVVGSLASTNSTAGVSVPASFSNVAQSALNFDRVYEQSDCVVRLSLIGEYLESKGWSAGVKQGQASRDSYATVPQGSMSMSQAQALTAASSAAGGANKQKCDPYVDIYGLARDEKTRRPYWKLAYSTEIIENTRSPKWNIFVLRVWDLCANDYYRPILLKVWDHSVFGSPEFIGEVQTNLKEILVKSMGQSRLELVHPTRSRASALQPQLGAGAIAFTTPALGTGAYESAGSLVFSYARVFSDVKYSQIERSGDGYPSDIVPLLNKKPIAQA